MNDAMTDGSKSESGSTGKDGGNRNDDVELQVHRDDD
jgi:hypothetical protein